MADLNPDLLQQAAELNIEVTERATNEALQAAIDEVLAEDAPPVGDIAALRSIYKAATGKNAFNGWDAEELQKRIDAALAGQQANNEGHEAASMNNPQAGQRPFAGKGDHDGDGKAGGAAAHLVPVLVKRDYWDAGGNRIRSGSVVEVSVEQALDGVESGALSRVK